MMKIFKILAYIVGILFVLLAAAIFAFSQYFDPNKYKDEIISLAKPYIGERQLNIEGQMDVSVFPWIGINIGRVTLSHPEGFEQGEMLSFDKANVSLKLSSLFQGNIEADKIELIKPYVHLITRADGSDNYSDLLNTGKASTASTQTHDVKNDNTAVSQPAEQGDAEVITSNEARQVQAEGATGFDLNRLRISGVLIEDGTVKIDNQKTAQNQHVSALNLELGEVQLGQVIDTALSADVTATQLPNPLSIDFNGEVEVQSDLSKIALFGTDIDIDYGDLPLSISVPALNYQKDIDALTLPELRVSQQDVNLNTAVTAHNLTTAPKINATVELSADDVKAALSRLGINLSELQHEIRDVRLNSKVDFENNQIRLSNLDLKSQINSQQTTLAAPTVWLDLNQELIEVEQLDLGHNTLKINLQKLNGVNILSELAAMQMSSQLNLSANNVGQLLADNGMDGILKSDAIGVLAVNGNVNLANNNLSVSGLDAAVDDMTINGSFAMQNLAAPAYDLDLNINEIDVDKLTGMLAESKPEKSTINPSANEEVNNEASAQVTSNDKSNDSRAKSGLAPAVELPVEPFKNLNVDANINVDRVLVSGLVMSQVQAVINAKNGVLKLSPLKAQMVEGDIESSITYDVSGQLPKVVLNNKVSSINIGELLRALEINDQLEGKANLSTDLTASGGSTDAMIANLAGQVNTQFLDGAVRGIDLQSTLLKLKNTIDSVKGSTQEQEQQYVPDVQTKFAELAASFNVSNGVFKSEDILMKAPALRLDGNGEINLPDSKLNMRLGINVVKTVEGQGGAGLEELEGVRIPFKVKGALTSPSYGIDFTALLKERAKQELKKELLKELPGEDEKIDKALQDPESALKDLAKEKLAEELGGGEGADQDPEKAQQAQDILEDPGKALEDAAKKELEKELEKGLKNLFDF